MRLSFDSVFELSISTLEQPCKLIFCTSNFFALSAQDQPFLVKSPVKSNFPYSISLILPFKVLNLYLFCKKKENARDKSISQKRRRKGGRPSKLDARDERQLLRTLKILRKEAEGQFLSKRLMEKAGIQESHASNRTVRRCLERHGYHFLQARKKGLMSSVDLKKRVTLAKNVKKTYPTTLWTEMVGFFLDGVSFYYKKNPAGQARAPRGRIWRQ